VCAFRDEPAQGAHFPSEVFGLSGIDQLRLFLTQQLDAPPVGYLTGMRPTEVGIGTATFTMPITDWLLTPQGIASAGAIAILADGPLGCAIQTVLPPATAYTTSDLSINMVRPVPRRGQLVARGRLIHGGRRLGLSEAFVTDDSGRLIAHTTSRCVVFPPMSAPPPPPSDLPLATPAPGTPPHRRPVLGSVIEQTVWQERSGLDVMRALIAGQLDRPPVSHLLDAVPVAAEEGRCTFEMTASGWLTSPTGNVEGGVTACLADFALAGAIQTTLPAATALAPTELRVQFVRPVPPDGGTVTAQAQVVHRGRNVAHARAELTNTEGKLVAVANGSAMVLPDRRADLADAEPALNP
jgi:uncharacterized protein (TIGR00369 family)